MHYPTGHSDPEDSLFLFNHSVKWASRQSGKTSLSMAFIKKEQTMQFLLQLVILQPSFKP